MQSDMEATLQCKAFSRDCGMIAKISKEEQGKVSS